MVLHLEKGGDDMGICAELRAKPSKVWKEWWKPQPEGRIYYIGCTETLRLKIGWTAGSPYDRMAQLQTGSPTQLVMLGSMLAQKWQEASLHERFRRERIRGEWFRISDRIYVHLEAVAEGETGVFSNDHRLLKFARRALDAAAAAEGVS